MIFQGATDPQTGRFDHGFGQLREAILREKPGAGASDAQRAAWQQRYDQYLQQRAWLELFYRLWGRWRTGLGTDDLLQRYGLIVDFTHLDDEAQFKVLITETLRSALGLAVLDPWRDELPGLLAVPVERHRLFFGRRELIEELDRRIFVEPSALVVVQGESGCGKSSLLRAGLIGHWSRWRMRSDCLVALVVEPRGLARQGDPLRGLAETLFGAAGARPRAVERADAADPNTPQPLLHREIDGPYPYRLPGLAKAAAREQCLGATPSIEAFLAALLAALRQATPLAAGQPLHLILILDQFEQIDDTAREWQQQRQEETGEKVPLELAGPWRRFLAALAVLVAGVGKGGRPALRPDIKIPGDPGILEGLAERLAVTVLVAVPRHRQAALDWLPLERLASPLAVPALQDEHLLQAIVDGTFEAYGLRDPEHRLAQAMAKEASELAKAYVPQERAEGQTGSPETSAATALPLLAMTLANLFTAWRQRSPVNQSLGQDAKILSTEFYAPLASVTRAIEDLGEYAWDTWHRVEVEGRGGRLGLLSGQELQSDLNRRFYRLMCRFVSRLVVGACSEEALRDAELTDTALSHCDSLVKELRHARLLVPVTQDRIRLGHRAILEHWRRAKDWLGEEGHLLDYRADLTLHRRLRFDIDASMLENYAKLYMRWPGSGRGEDGELKAYCRGILLQHFPVEDQHGLESSRLTYLPAWAAANDQPLAEGLVARLSSEKTDSATVALRRMLITAVKTGNLAVAELCLAAGVSVDFMDSETGLFPLLLAAQNGHTAVVERLLEKGAEPDQAHQPSGTTPLILAIARNNASTAELLLRHGADEE